MACSSSSSKALSHSFEHSFSLFFNRDGLLQLLFVAFEVPVVHLTTAPFLAAHSAGLSTALVVDMGEQAVQVLPVLDGHEVLHSGRRVKHLGGQVMSCLLEGVAAESQEMRALGLSDFEVSVLARDIKERLGRCAKKNKNGEADGGEQGQVLQAASEYAVPLPGGPGLVLSDEQLVHCGELLFDPKRILMDEDSSVRSLPELLAEVVEATAMDMRKPLLSNVLLCGGGAALPGLAERLAQELAREMPFCAPYVKVRVHEHGQQAAWAGGSTMVREDPHGWSERADLLIREDYLREIGHHVEEDGGGYE